MKIWLPQCRKFPIQLKMHLKTGRKLVSNEAQESQILLAVRVQPIFVFPYLLDTHAHTHIHMQVHQAFILCDVQAILFLSFSLFPHNCDEIRGGMRPIRKCIIRGQRTYKNASEQKGLCILSQQGISQNHHEHFLELSTQQNVCLYRYVHVHLLDSQRGKCREEVFFF